MNTKKYIFTYRDGVQSLPIFSIVEASEEVSHRAVVEKAQKYCRQKNYRYVSVRPMILDLDEGNMFAKNDGKIEINIPKDIESRETVSAVQK